MHGMHMALPRRYLPSMSLLVAFEAVCRTGSAAAAARELALTQGTVSRLVRALEDQLGTALFRRERKRLIPTEAARAYAAEVARAIDIVGRASVALASAPGSGVLNLAILPTFGTHWLAPRLGRFLSANPGVTVNLSTRLRPFDFLAEGFDAAIHFGRPDWPGAGHLMLFDERLVACAAPSLAKDMQLKAPADVARAPLLALETRPGGWRGFFRHHGIAGEPQRGMVFDQFATMMQAAIHGLGVALLPEFLAEEAIADGRLIALSPAAATGQGSYHLVWPTARADWPPLAAFRDWIAGEAAGAGD
ncbi:MAG: LysR family transcriptional regulator [Rhodobacteraceae bacterium]|nr:LysR family transcriptional regulator [Paracoccaceae bacterium]